MKSFESNILEGNVYFAGCGKDGKEGSEGKEGDDGGYAPTTGTINGETVIGGDFQL